jgi:hypothetical protein
VGQQVIVELKNGMMVQGKLKAVDQYHNVRIDEIKITEPEKYPHLVRFTYHLPYCLLPLADVWPVTVPISGSLNSCDC